MGFRKQFLLLDKILDGDLDPTILDKPENRGEVRNIAFDKYAMSKIATYMDSMNIVANSEVAMNSIANSEVAMNAIWNSETAWNAIKNEDMAIAKYVVGRAGVNPADYDSMNAVTSSEVAMNAVASSELAMNAVTSSEVAMNAVARSEVAINSIANSLLAITKIGNSNIIQNNDEIVVKMLSYISTGVVQGATKDDFVNLVWNDDTARQNMWNSRLARELLWQRLDFLQYAVGDDGSESANIDTSKLGSPLVYSNWSSSGPKGWHTQVSVNDGRRYICFIKFHSHFHHDWYNGRVCNYGGTECRQVNGGYDLTRGMVHKTSSGCLVQFYDNYNDQESGSYARSWRIAVEDEDE